MKFFLRGNKKNILFLALNISNYNIEYINVIKQEFYKYLLALYYSYTVNRYWQPVVNSKIAIDNRLSIPVAFLYFSSIFPS